MSLIGLSASGVFSVASLFVSFAEGREGRLHSHHLRGGLQPGEARTDRRPGSGAAGSDAGAEVEEGKQDRSEE